MKGNRTKATDIYVGVFDPRLPFFLVFSDLSLASVGIHLRVTPQTSFSRHYMTLRYTKKGLLGGGGVCTR